MITWKKFSNIFLEELFQFLQIPSISADPHYSKDVITCCEFLANHLFEVLQAPVALVGFAYPDNNAHAPNEHMSEEAFYKGIEIAVHLLNELKEWKKT